MYIRASSAYGLKKFTIQISQGFTTGILIQWKFIISASGTVLSKCSTSRLGVSKTLRFGLNLMSSLHISLTFRFCQLQVKYKSSFISTFLEYAYQSTGLWNWERCLGQLHHWHWEIQVPERRTSISHKTLVELTFGCPREAHYISTSLKIPLKSDSSPRNSPQVISAAQHFSTHCYPTLLCTRPTRPIHTPVTGLH